MTTYINKYFKTTEGNISTFYSLRMGTHIYSLSEVNIFTGEDIADGNTLGVYIEKSEATAKVARLIESGAIEEVDDYNPYGIGLFTMIKDTSDEEVYVVNSMSATSSQVVNFNSPSNTMYASGTREEVVEALTRGLADGSIEIYRAGGGS